MSTQTRLRIVGLLYEHEDRALTNYDNDGREECRCGKQPLSFSWREHFADVLIEQGIAT